MKSNFHRAGLKELRAVRNQSRGLYFCIALFSVFVNALMLTGPLYMMQVYDRVLGSRSVATLLALSLLVVTGLDDPVLVGPAQRVVLDGSFGNEASAALRAGLALQEVGR